MQCAERLSRESGQWSGRVSVERTRVGPTIWKNQRWPILFPPLGVDLRLELEQPLPKKDLRGESLFLPVVRRPVNDEDILRSTVVVPRLDCERPPVLSVEPEHGYT
jgi:hypothetical protein